MNKKQSFLRMKLKTVNTPGRRAFPRGAAPFSRALAHIAGFQTLYFKAFPAKMQYKIL